MQLSEYQVPTLRAIWLLKMNSAYSVAISEAKMKKRQVPDSSQGWFPFLFEKFMIFSETWTDVFFFKL